MHVAEIDCIEFMICPHQKHRFSKSGFMGLKLLEKCVCGSRTLPYDDFWNAQDKKSSESALGKPANFAYLDSLCPIFVVESLCGLSTYPVFL